MVPGVSSGGGPFAGPSARVADQFSLRGQRLNGDRDVRIDGFAGAAMRNDFDLAAFERVEVVKGPSSMLYGQGSLGGFINLVRKRPLAEPTSLVSSQAGSYDTYRAEADVTGPFDDNARFLGRMTAAYEDAGSFIDGVESRRVLTAPTFEARLGEDTRAILDLMYQRDNFRPSPGIPLRLDGDRLKEPNISRSFYFGVPAERDSTTSPKAASLQLDHEIDDRWLDSEYIDKDDPNYGLTPPETTDRTVSLFASYELQEGSLQGLGFGATLVSVGERWSIKNDENVSPGTIWAPPCAASAGASRPSRPCAPPC